jgi:endonuclease III
MPTLVFIEPTMRLHITADRLFAAKGLRLEPEDNDDDNDDDEDEDKEEEDYEQEIEVHEVVDDMQIPAPAPPAPTPKANTRASKRRQPLLPIVPTKKQAGQKGKPAAKTKVAKTKKTVAKAAPKAKKAIPPTKATLPTPAATSSLLGPLPDGSYETWEAFVDAGGYDITRSQALTVKAWVKSLDPVWISEQVKFHKAIFSMRLELEPSSRDGWADVLPKRHSMNFDFCCLILMVATPAVPDSKILPVFGKLFRDNYVDPKWILDQGESKLQAIFAPLGRQKETTKYVIGIAHAWQGMPRDYRRLLPFPGVGPKVALVTIDECFKHAQGVPCDIHMVRIFRTLGWMPTNISVSDSWAAKETSQHEFARAAIEGWFPNQFWSQLNKTWAGLGQLFRSTSDTTKMAQWVDKHAKDCDSTLRLSDLEKLTLIHGAYK